MAEQVQQTKSVQPAAKPASKPAQSAGGEVMANPAMAMENSWTGVFKKWWFWAIIGAVVVGSLVYFVFYGS